MSGADPQLRDWDDEDPDLDDPSLAPYWFPGEALPHDARRMGLTHHTVEGALLDFGGRLDATKAVHRWTAWFLLAVFGLPVVFAVMRVFYYL